MVDWLLLRAAKTKGSDEDKKSLQLAVTVTALKLAKPDQMPQVKVAVDKYGTKLEKDAFVQVDNLLKACGDRVAVLRHRAAKGRKSRPRQAVRGHQGRLHDRHLG